MRCNDAVMLSSAHDGMQSVRCMHSAEQCRVWGAWHAMVQNPTRHASEGFGTFERQYGCLMAYVPYFFVVGLILYYVSFLSLCYVSGVRALMIFWGSGLSVIALWVLCILVLSVLCTWVSMVFGMMRLWIVTGWVCPMRWIRAMVCW